MAQNRPREDEVTLIVALNVIDNKAQWCVDMAKIMEAQGRDLQEHVKRIRRILESEEQDAPVRKIDT